MSRSKWKGPFVDKSLFTRNTKTSTPKTSSRSSTITPKLVNRALKVHNGKEFQKILITEKMIGHKLGEFSFTRKKFSFKKKSSKK